MSHQALRLVMGQPAGTLADHAVLVAVAWHAGRAPVPDSEGVLAYEAWPSVATIAREAGLRRRDSARVALRRLQDEGRLAIVERHGRANLYRIPLPTLHASRGGSPPTPDVDPLSRGGGEGPSTRQRGDPPRAAGGEQSENSVYRSSSDLDTRARDDDEDALYAPSDDARQRAIAALGVLREREVANGTAIPEGERLARRLLWVRDLTDLADRHPQWSPDRLASCLDYVLLGDEDDG